MPQSFKPGIRYGGAFGQQLNFVHSQGVSDGSVNAMVVDPTLLTGDTYKINFTQIGDKVLWNLIDSTTGELKLQDQTDQSGTSSNLLIDGIQVSVNNPAGKGVERYKIIQGNYVFTPGYC